MITNSMLNNLAKYFDSHVSEVLINGTVSVTEISVIEVEENRFLIEFDVPEGITQISQFQIIDGEGNVISSNNLFVPIEGDIRFKYILTFTNARR